MSRKPTNQEKPEVATTGHEWDGIKEYDNPMPRWWLWTLYATIAWGVWYTIAYPAWPLIQRATAGYSGYSTRAEVQADIDAVNAQNASLNTSLADADMNALVADPSTELYGYAVNMGRSVFSANCSQCHGAGAAGVQASGFPSLIDDDWLWGGTIDDIVFTVTNGIRNEQSPDARWVEMPAFGDILSHDEIAAIANHVRQISGQDFDAALADQGTQLFLDNCASCHGDTGDGDRTMGAPRLNDAVWLYGGSLETIEQTITNARFGVMPSWSHEWRGASGLDPAEINAVAAYVHQLGGGE